VLEWISEVAYCLELPASAKVHPVFHVSQLKLFTASYAPVFSELPVAPNLQVSAPVPVEILECCLVQKGNAAVPQVLIRWAHMPEGCTTWEDYYVLKNRYPDALIWTQDQEQTVQCQGGNCHTLYTDGGQRDAWLSWRAPRAQRQGKAEEKSCDCHACSVC
jgi:hypothetical protein